MASAALCASTSPAPTRPSRPYKQLVRSLTYQDTFTLRPAGDRALSIFIQDAEAHSNFYDFFVNVDPHPTRAAA